MELGAEGWRGTYICSAAECHGLEEYCVVEDQERLEYVRGGPYERKQMQTSIEASHWAVVAWDTPMSAWSAPSTNWIQKRKGLAG